MNRPRRSGCNPKSLVAMGIPRKYVDYTMRDFKTFGDEGLAEVRDFCIRYLKDFEDNFENGRGIMFCGSNGVGKTMLSCILLKEAYMRRLSGRRVTFSKYINEYASSWKKSGSDAEEIEQEVFEKYKSAEFLVLEEIGKEIDSKIAKPILEDLLRYREEQSYPTIICSNMSIKDILEDYGASIVSIIKGCTTYVRVVSRDRRAGKGL